MLFSKVFLQLLHLRLQTIALLPQLLELAWRWQRLGRRSNRARVEKMRELLN